MLTARLAAEYDLATRLDGAPFQAARWLEVMRQRTEFAILGSKLTLIPKYRKEISNKGGQNDIHHTRP